MEGRKKDIDFNTWVRYDGTWHSPIRWLAKARNRQTDLSKAEYRHVHEILNDAQRFIFSELKKGNDVTELLRRYFKFESEVLYSYRSLLRSAENHLREKIKNDEHTRWE